MALCSGLGSLLADESPLVSVLSMHMLPCRALSSDTLLLIHMFFCAGASTVPTASPATLPNSHLEANSSHYLKPAQPLSPPRGTTELGGILEPGHLGSSGQWDLMRPQKGSINGDLSSCFSMYQLNSKPTGKAQSPEGSDCSMKSQVGSTLCLPRWHFSFLP